MSNRIGKKTAPQGKRPAKVSVLLHSKSYHHIGIGRFAPEAYWPVNYCCRELRAPPAIIILMNGDRPRAHSTEDSIEIAGSVFIPRSELEISASRASGAGGQHVNKTSSRVEIKWNIVRSRVLSDEQRERLTSRLASRLSEEGSIRVVASDTRSQLRNRQTAERRLADTVARALAVPKKRKPTRRPRSADEARLTEKKKHSDKKRDRQQRIPE